MAEFGTLLRLVEDMETLGPMLDAILADSTNLDRYLVLADYLEESGDRLGEMVRAAILLHRTDFPSTRYRGLYAKWNAVRKALTPEFAKQNIHFNRLLNDRLLGLHFRWGKRKIYLRPHDLIDRDSDQTYQPSQLPYQIQRAIVYLLCEVLAQTHIMVFSRHDKMTDTPQNNLADNHLDRQVSILSQMLSRMGDLTNARKAITDQIGIINRLLDQRNGRNVPHQQEIRQRILRTWNYQHLPADLHAQVEAILRRLRDAEET